jgi:hypothetical protein
LFTCLSTTPFLNHTLFSIHTPHLLINHTLNLALFSITPSSQSTHLLINHTLNLALFSRYNEYATDPLCRKEVKLKHPRQLTSAIAAGREIIASADATDEERARSATIVDVLERFPLQVHSYCARSHCSESRCVCCFCRY